MSDDDETPERDDEPGRTEWTTWVASNRMAGDVPGFDRIDSVVEVGRGGNAVVYRGTERAFDRTVAVKVLSHRIQDDAERQRFERECKAVGGLSGHPNVVVVYSAGESTDGHPYIVMEYLPRSLADRLVGEGRVEWREACEIGRAVGGALAAAHDRGVLHRDIKPENILLTAAGVPKLTDFGLARMAGGYESETTNVRASLTHAPPELLEGEAVNEATDVYSLASTIHHLISGRAPFVRAGDVSIITVVNRVLREPPPPLAPFGVPSAVESVLVKAMSKRSQDRPASVREFLALMTAAIERPLGAVAVEPERSRGRWVVPVAMLLVLLLGGGVAAWAITSDDDGSTTGGTTATASSDASVTSLTITSAAPSTSTSATASMSTIAPTTSAASTTSVTTGTTIATPVITTTSISGSTTIPAPTVTTRPTTVTTRPAAVNTTPTVAPTTVPETAPPTAAPTTTPPTVPPTAAPPTLINVPNVLNQDFSAGANAINGRGLVAVRAAGACEQSSTITDYQPRDPQPAGTAITLRCE